jgi:hypothetical protein
MTTEPAWKAYPLPPAGVRIKDTMGVPHPYCITPKHLADEDGMYLDGPRIERAEKRGARCDICKGKLSFKEHKQGLVVFFEGFHQPELNKRLSEGFDKVVPGLHAWLLAIKPLMERDQYDGLALEAEFR